MILILDVPIFLMEKMNVQNEGDIEEWYQFRLLANWRHLIKIGN